LASEAVSNENRPTQSARGSDGYRAPELVDPSGEAAYGKKCDIWAMGCILYELAIGARAFNNDVAVFQHKISGKNKEVPLDDTFDERSKRAITKNIIHMLQIAPSARPSVSFLLNEFINQCQPTLLFPVVDEMLYNETDTSDTGSESLVSITGVGRTNDIDDETVVSSTSGLKQLGATSIVVGALAATVAGVWVASRRGESDMLENRDPAKEMPERQEY
jgi:serine/threonine protein kinase